jgi:putative transposase
VPKLAAMMCEAEADVLAYMRFAAAHRTKLHSTNPIERLKRRDEAAHRRRRRLPNEQAIIRLVGAPCFWSRTMNGRCSGRAT